MSRTKLMLTDELLHEKLFTDVARVGACLERTKNVTQNGYGEISLGVGRRVYAHRLAWQLSRGAIPADKWVLHRCDNRRCVNIDHLYLGTVVENARDMRERGRHFSKVHPELVVRGAQHGMAKLTAERARTLREIYALQQRPMRELAAQYNVSLKTVLNVLQGRIWCEAGGPLIEKPVGGALGRGRSKLSNLLAEIICVNHKAGIGQKMLARWFAVHPATIRAVIAGRRYGARS